MSTITFEQFIEQFMVIQNDVIRDHSGEGGRITSICHVMHRDIRLGETTRDDAEESVARVKEMTGEDVDPTIIDLTEEHALLHKFLAKIKMEAMMTGTSPDELMATMFVIGRRYGMREAAEMFDCVPDSIGEEPK